MYPGRTTGKSECTMVVLGIKRQVKVNLFHLLKVMPE